MGNVERLPVRNATERVAVLLNANARSVSDALKRELENFVPPEDLYYSRCFDDARSIARQVLDKGYRTVLTGGGDGTFVGYVNCLFEQARQPSASTARGALKLMPVPAHEILMPRFGVLRLGTGNAVAEFAGASGRRLGVVEDILRARSGEVSMARPLHLLLHEGKRAPFAGLGIDAKVLNDYVSIRDHIGPGGLGYFCSVVAKTLPSYMLERGVPEVEVMNLGGPAQQIGPDGKPIGRDFGAGEVIYRGPCKIAAAGTVPYYGFGLRVLPYALRAPGRFQLRLTAIGVPEILSNLRTLWRGGPPPPGIPRFHFAKGPTPFGPGIPPQGGGAPWGT